MSFVPAICPKCGGTLEVDPAADAAVCKYCGTPFIVEKAITAYNTINNITHTEINNVMQITNVTNNIKDSEIHIHGEKDDAQSLLENIKALICRENYSAASGVISELTKKFPADYRVDEANLIYELRRGIKDLAESPLGYRIGDTLKILCRLMSLNKEAGKVYAEQIRSDTNEYLNKLCHAEFSGGLAFFKIKTVNLYREIKSYDYAFKEQYIRYAGNYGDINAKYHSAVNAFCKFVEAGFDELKSIREESELFGYDDAFCEYAVAEANKYKDGYINGSKALTLDMDVFDRIENGLIARMTPEGSARYAEAQRKREEEENRRRIDSVKKQIEKLWLDYTALLKNGKYKDALSLIENALYYPDGKAEASKFKKTLFGYKYLGDALDKSVADVLKECGLL